MSKLRKVMIAAAALCGAALVPTDLVAPSAYDTSSSSSALYAVEDAWNFHSRHQDYPACAAAAATQGHSWQCIMNPEGTYDLRLWY